LLWRGKLLLMMMLRLLMMILRLLRLLLRCRRWQQRRCELLDAS